MNVFIIIIPYDELIETEINPATVLLDFVRNQRLTGTKEGCKEGDCGACTVLTGELSRGEIKYRAINSCLIPLQNVIGKHIVTIEGINQNDNFLNPLQQAFVDEGASQCGFCTPGFIISLTGFFLNNTSEDKFAVLDALDGNICRCTGHNSIIRAAESISEKFKFILNTNGTKLKYLTDNKIIPEYFLSVKSRLEKLENENSSKTPFSGSTKYFIGGGTDLFVQRPDEMLSSEISFLSGNKNLTGIIEKDGKCFVGSSTTVTELLESSIIKKIIPGIDRFAELFGSTPIRNSATVGGNLNNASPIGDMTAFFMGLNSSVILKKGNDNSKRVIPLNKFYKGYKVTERNPDELMEAINFTIPCGYYFFNFEKVSKRTYLDIATVNSAMLINVENGSIINVNISAGGVGPTPLYLFNTCNFLNSKELNFNNIKEAVTIADSEIAPISDARGSSEYKRLLLSRLIYLHFINLFPEIINLKDTL
ncbi:MAG: FAD binding domain-containing protein [bacterium]